MKRQDPIPLYLYRVGVVDRARNRKLENSVACSGVRAQVLAQQLHLARGVCFGGEALDVRHDLIKVLARKVAGVESLVPVSGISRRRGGEILDRGEEVSERLLHAGDAELLRVMLELARFERFEGIDEFLRCANDDDPHRGVALLLDDASLAIDIVPDRRRPRALLGGPLLPLSGARRTGGEHRGFAPTITFVRRVQLFQEVGGEHLGAQVPVVAGSFVQKRCFAIGSEGRETVI
mmetsp:Transcript_11487/g.37773  ORF Transcript_11487/g.37773 Transcript_11487/m.37773 type:complete len:235 (-) Transcript_11487:1530-2234(-)